MSAQKQALHVIFDQDELAHLSGLVSRAISTGGFEEADLILEVTPLKKIDDEEACGVDRVEAMRVLLEPHGRKGESEESDD